MKKIVFGFLTALLFLSSCSIEYRQRHGHHDGDRGRDDHEHHYQNR